MQPENPYQSPVAYTLDEPRKSSDQGGLASRSQRLANFVIDQFFMTIMAFALTFVMAILWGAETLASIPNILWGSLALVIYFVPQEATFGRSLGKIITGTKVIAKDGSDPGIGRILGRTFARMIPFEPLSFLSGHDAIGWHDQLSGTRVVRTR